MFAELIKYYLHKNKPHKNIFKNTNLYDIGIDYMLHVIHAALSQLVQSNAACNTCDIGFVSKS